MDTFLGIIPARYASTRFPGKPLANIKGKAMIQRVYERAVKVIDNVVVATDDERILNLIRSNGGKAVMTSVDHQSGTDRCSEALILYQELVGKTFDIVINIQGDEPFIKPDQIELLKSCFIDSTVDIATLIKVIGEKSVIYDPNRPKVVVNNKMEALYFSRSPIPFVRGEEENNWIDKHKFYQHIGMYAYRSEVLKKITRLESSSLEKAESLEQLRWLENGLKIKTAVTKFESYGIDTPKDLEDILKRGIL